jgi:hypothetical protein
MIQEIKAFKTSDQKTHESKLMALLHEQDIEIRGILQSDEDFGKNPTISHQVAAKNVIRNFDKISKVMAKYKQAINRERAKANPIPAIKTQQAFA